MTRLQRILISILFIAIAICFFILGYQYRNQKLNVVIIDGGRDGYAYVSIEGEEKTRIRMLATDFNYIGTRMEVQSPKLGNYPTWNPMTVSASTTNDKIKP